jgi:hypothetical protein
VWGLYAEYIPRICTRVRRAIAIGNARILHEPKGVWTRAIRHVSVYTSHSHKLSYGKRSLLVLIHGHGHALTQRRCSTTEVERE